MNSVEKKVHELEQRVAALTTRVADLEAVKAAPAMELSAPTPVPAEESGADSSAQ